MVLKAGPFPIVCFPFCAKVLMEECIEKEAKKDCLLSPVTREVWIVLHYKLSVRGWGWGWGHKM